MPLRQNTFTQISDAYRAMARHAKYRPAAPSDGMGNITVPRDQLDMEHECRGYARRWAEEEDTQTFRIGCCNFPTRPATIYTVEAARLMCGVADEEALRLLKMAVAELEAVIAGRNARRAAGGGAG